MQACIISIGHELVSGSTVDTNTAWLARELASQGIACLHHVTVEDSIEAIRDAILSSTRQATLVLVTGGLGPTPDDLTREALADALKCKLVTDPNSMEDIKAYFAERNRRMHKANERQANLPEAAEAIRNTHGTAPGMRTRLNDADVYCLPGVPYEMKEMFRRSVQPAIDSRQTDDQVICERIIRTFGMSESEVGSKLSDLMRRGRNPTIGTSAGELVISIRLTCKADTRDAASAILEGDISEIRQRLGDVVYGEADETLADAVGQLLHEHRLTIATAESCTGGLIAKRLTDRPGSSVYMMQGLVTYANHAKQALLGVPESLLVQHGAVSEACAIAMAEGCRENAGTDYAISATGIAGPGGATDEKPIGLVYVGMATPTGTRARELRLGENLTRDQVRDRTAKIALNLLRIDLIRGT